ncbi:hypothetical protein [Salinirubrum litoreum]|uniref:GAF domain-containing protein n=1 Tax=Salinirubrum litoreum TaxID=1126234 RepID=A0ABD5R9E7_9EURY|nr:hypothetical protein [Salinirubrum litoreum]
MSGLGEQAELIAFCREMVGDAFYGVIAYWADDFELLHIHDTIRTVVTDDQVQSLVENARDIHAVVTDAGSVDSAVGRPRTVLTEFQNMLTVQVPVDEHRGVVVAFDPSVGSNFTEFTHRLAQRIDA